MESFHLIKMYLLFLIPSCVACGVSHEIPGCFRLVFATFAPRNCNILGCSGVLSIFLLFPSQSIYFKLRLKKIKSKSDTSSF